MHTPYSDVIASGSPLTFLRCTHVMMLVFADHQPSFTGDSTGAIFLVEQTGLHIYRIHSRLPDIRLIRGLTIDL